MELAVLFGAVGGILFLTENVVTWFTRDIKKGNKVKRGA